MSAVSTVASDGEPEQFTRVKPSTVAAKIRAGARPRVMAGPPIGEARARGRVATEVRRLGLSCAKAARCATGVLTSAGALNLHPQRLRQRESKDHRQDEERDDPVCVPAEHVDLAVHVADPDRLGVRPPRQRGFRRVDELIQ